MSSTIQQVSDFLPPTALPLIVTLLEDEQLVLKVKKERKTRHGDYKRLSDGQHIITLNSNLNPYKFLITLVHEIAHLRAYIDYGYQIKPHGQEWKHTFQRIMLPFIQPDIFPEKLLREVARHFKNPRASSDSDAQLAIALKVYDAKSDKVLVQSINEGQVFKLYNGRIFKRGAQRRKRIECLELSTDRIYLFNPLVEVDLIE